MAEEELNLNSAEVIDDEETGGSDSGTTDADGSDKDGRPEDVYFLLGRYATLTIWDFNSPGPAGEFAGVLESPSGAKVYDFTNCLSTSPGEKMFDQHRSLAGDLATSQFMLEEAHRRGWIVELSGYDKMVRAAWVRAMQLDMTVEGYQPDANDYELYLSKHTSNFQPKTVGEKPSQAASDKPTLTSS